LLTFLRNNNTRRRTIRYHWKCKTKDSRQRGHTTGSTTPDICR